MKYRHSFHAGNFADVHKHVTLVALIAALQRKDKGFLYLETHAGRGLYDLSSADTHQGAEAQFGISALKSSRAALGKGVGSPQIDAYLAALTRIQSDADAYPGSPLLAAEALRSQDRGLCCEIQAAESRALERALTPYPRMRSECLDGYQGLKAHLPPRERRALVLIDPPYEEQDDDLLRALEGLHTVLSRLANAVIALWYPIKDEPELPPKLAHAANQLAVPSLVSELWVHPRDARVGLNGSGLLIVNPPYQLDVEMEQWLPELGTALGANLGLSGQGGTRVQWVAREPITS